MFVEESIFEDGGVWLKGPLLGEGGFGCVNLAIFPTLAPLRYQNLPPHKFIAVKSTAICENLVSLVSEKMIFDVLGDSPFLIRCFGSDQTTSSSGEDFYNLFLEYASLGSLSDMIKNNNNGLGLLESQVKEITRSILGGIDHIHSLGYVHCDIKPQNILLVKDDSSKLGFTAKIADFGLTKRADVAGSRVRGTRMYFAPECVLFEIQEKESDMWALGCVVYSMLTGTMRWRYGPNLNELIDNYVSNEAFDFVKKLLVLKREYRVTAAELLSHPFLIGYPEEEHLDDQFDFDYYKSEICPYRSQEFIVSEY